MDELIRFNGQLYKRVDRMSDGDPENVKELHADLAKCKKVEHQIEIVEKMARDLDYLLGSLAIPSTAITELEKGLNLARKELKEREHQLSSLHLK